MPRPRLELLENTEIETIYSNALDVLDRTGITFYNDEALKILDKAGAEVKNKTAHIPTELVKEALNKAPKSIRLYDRGGEHYLSLEGDNVYFSPGGTAINFVDSDTGQMRKPVTADLVTYVRVTDALEYIHAAGTTLVVDDAPKPIVDRYRLYVVLRNTIKSIFTGAFTIDGLIDMKDMLVAIAGSEEDLAKKPRAVMCSCPSPPLKWSNITSQNLIDSAKFKIPVWLLSMPQSGLTSPVTLSGTLVQHTAETLAGLVLSQIVNPGTPFIYGGSPSTLDLRYVTSLMGAIETDMICCALVQIGKYFNLPTQAHLGLSDSMIVDVQAGLEASMGLVLGALAGVNMIYGPGMLEFESCQSLEKLVIDNDICGMALRLVRGIDTSEKAMAIDIIKEVGAGGDYTKSVTALKFTRGWFKKEQFIPSSVISRRNRSEWERQGSTNTLERTRRRVREILTKHQIPPLPQDIERKLDEIITASAKRHGVKVPLLKQT